MKEPAIALWLVEHWGQHDVNMRVGDSGGFTALHWACMQGLLPVVRALVGAGAKPSPPNSPCCTPLMLASSNGHDEVICLAYQSVYRPPESLSSGSAGILYPDCGDIRQIECA